jgi:hypothetical protein
MKETHHTPKPGPEEDETPPPPLTQAERVIAKFGGVPELHAALKRNGINRYRTSLYKWKSPKPIGTGGTIPRQALQEVCEVAIKEGIILTAEDLDPRGDLGLIRRQSRPGPKKGWKKKKIEQLQKLKAELAKVEEEIVKAGDDGVNYDE